MKKLIFCSMEHGHLELTEEHEIETKFMEIINNGYGNRIPAMFHTTLKDGSVVVKKGKDAESLLRDPNVEEVTIIPTLVGG